MLMAPLSDAHVPKFQISTKQRGPWGSSSHMYVPVHVFLQKIKKKTTETILILLIP